MELVADFARVIKASGVLERARTTSSAFSNFPAHLSEAGKLPRKRRFCDSPRIPPPAHVYVAPFCGPAPPARYLYLSNSGAHIRRDDFERKLDAGKKIPSSFRDISREAKRERYARDRKEGGRDCDPLRNRHSRSVAPASHLARPILIATDDESRESELSPLPIMIYQKLVQIISSLARNNTASSDLYVKREGRLLIAFTKEDLPKLRY